MKEVEDCTCALSGRPDAITSTVMGCPAHADSETGRTEAFIAEAWEGIWEVP